MPSIPFGLNFSHRRAAQFGFDPHEAFYALLIHLKPRHLRLSLYWDEVAPNPGEYAFGEARWYLDRAEEYGCRVLLTAGYKPQRHPDFAPPRWLRDDATHTRREAAGQERLAAVLLMSLERAVALLADYDAIDSWQVENEPFLPARDQPPGWSFSRSLVLREAEVIRDVDPRYRPVAINAGGLHAVNGGLQAALTTGDVLGWNVQPLSANARGPANLMHASTAGLLAWQLRFQAMLAARFGKQCWITELPIEPAAQSRDGLAAAESRLGPWPQIFSSSIAFARRSGATRVYLLGVEWWLLKRNQGEPALWDAARSLLREGVVPPP